MVALITLYQVLTTLSRSWKTSACCALCRSSSIFPSPIPQPCLSYTVTLWVYDIDSWAFAVSTSPLQSFCVWCPEIRWDVLLVNNTYLVIIVVINQFFLGYLFYYLSGIWGGSRDTHLACHLELGLGLSCFFWSWLFLSNKCISIS